MPEALGRPRKLYLVEEFPSGLWVSTLDYFEGDSDQNTHLYETIVFEAPDNLAGLERHEYATADLARRGHEAIVARYRELEATR